jgi:hypothetical protein
MILIKRGEVYPVFKSEAVDIARREAERFYDTPQSSRKQSRFAFERHFRPLAEKLLLGLRVEFLDKCAYCETLFSRASAVTNVFRPYDGVEESGGEYLGDHYWAQAFEWHNFVASCNVCARYKGQRFPVKGKRGAANASRMALQSEEPLLLDPCSDLADEHLLFLPDGSVSGRTDRGRHSIEIYGLARSDLVKARADEAQRFLVALRGDAAGRDAAEAMTRDREPFAALKRQLLASEPARAGVGVSVPLAGVPSATAAGSVSAAVPVAVQKQAVAAQRAFDAEREAVSTESKSGLQHYRARARFIERVQIHNFLSIERLDLDPASSEADRAPCFAILGDNAVGKSSVLKAIALALGGARYAERLQLKPADVLRYGADAGQVSLWVSGFKEPTVMRFKRRARALQFEQEQSRALLFGYGSSRLLPSGRHRPRKGMQHAKIDNLFDPFLPLSDAEAWLLKAKPEQFDEAAMRIRQLLMWPDETTLVRSRGKQPTVRVEVKPPGRSRAVPQRYEFKHLSDGYQSMLGFAADLMEIMFGQGYQSMGAAQGVVLIDELGNHLHPRWRMQIVARLREAFPNVQFVFSTHDPLCLRGLRTGEVVVLQLDAQRKVYALTDLPSISGLRVDQLLQSEHFGLGSTVEPEMQQDYERYLTLKRVPTRSAEQGTELDRLAQRLFDPRALAASPQERVVLDFMEGERQRGPDNDARNLSVAQLDQLALEELRKLMRKAGGTTQ